MQTTTPLKKINDRLSVPAHTHPLAYFDGVKKHKSAWRAIRRGHLSKSGKVLPSRPFNNRKRTLGRKFQEELQKACVKLKGYQYYLNLAKLIDTQNAKQH